MRIQTNVQFSPVYESISSLTVYFQKNNYFEIGKKWFKSIETNDKNQLLKTFEEKSNLPYISYLHVLVWKSPNTDDLLLFASWLKELSAGEIKELLSPYLSEGLPEDLEDFRDYYVELLRVWNQLYTVEKSTLLALEQEANYFNQLVDKIPNQDLIEKATNGVYLELDQSVKEIILIPSFHMAPFNRIYYLNDLLFIVFSIDLPNDDANTPSTSLVRLTKSLSDEKRLRILKTISKKSMSLTEISRAVKMSSSHLHYHLTLMRAAGLIRIINNVSTKSDQFMVRPGVFSLIEKKLEEYVYSE